MTALPVLLLMPPCIPLLLLLLLFLLPLLLKPARTASSGNGCHPCGTRPGSVTTAAKYDHTTMNTYSAPMQPSKHCSLSSLNVLIKQVYTVVFSKHVAAKRDYWCPQQAHTLWPGPSL